MTPKAVREEYTHEVINGDTNPFTMLKDTKESVGAQS